MSQRFEIAKSSIPGLYSVQRKPIAHDLGSLVRVFCQAELGCFGFDSKIAQINHTFTVKKGSVRGMHYQTPPFSEAKFVTCLKGEVFDVAIDLRRGSPTFLEWHGEFLSFENQKSVIIPKGFAHGFQSLSDNCEMLYLHSCEYSPANEEGLHPLDNRLHINWPIEISELSDRDRNQLFLRADFDGVEI